MPSDLHRLRITFSKNAPLKYTSHLDLARAWERSLRRAGVPLAYSHGFNPRPKLQLAAALPLGHTSEAEILDAWLEKPMPVQDFVRVLIPVLPNGFTVSQVHRVPLREPALQTRIVSAEYHVTVEWDERKERIEAHIAQVLAATELPHERRGREYDLRPMVEHLRLEDVSEGEAVLEMQLAAREGATARPEAVLDVLGVEKTHARYHRRRLMTSNG